MTSFIHLVRQILLGSVPINEKRKYQIFGVLVALIHFIFTMVFLQVGQHFLFCYNVCVVLFYISMVVLMEFSSRYTLIFFSTYVEIMLHSMLASLIMGFNWGFMYYTIGLIPMVFYMTYTLPYFKKSISTPFAASLIIIVCYFVVYAITSGGSREYYSTVYPVIADRIYVFNNFLAFMFILAMSLLYAIEIRFMQRSLENKNRVLESEANHDALTGLLNRRSMNNVLKRAAEKADAGGQGFCILMTDIDDFKKVNDTYGHAKGDDVLVNVATIIKENIREGDTACRFGGEEMLVLISGGMDVAKIAAKRIVEGIRNSIIDAENDRIQITITIGVAEYKMGDNVRNVIEMADERLYHGKKNGKDRVVSE